MLSIKLLSLVLAATPILAAPSPVSGPNEHKPLARPECAPEMKPICVTAQNMWADYDANNVNCLTNGLNKALCAYPAELTKFAAPIQARWNNPTPIYPDAKGRYPDKHGNYPTKNGLYPDAKGRYPDKHGNYPTKDGLYPDAKGRYPDKQGNYPTKDGYYPDKKGNYPDKYHNYPDINGKYPTYANNYYGHHR